MTSSRETQREEEKFDGYYALVTSEWEKGDKEIVEIYHGLWRIEEAFKVTKSDLEASPVYVSRHDHIQAHFLICFVALVMPGFWPSALAINTVSPELWKA